VKELKGFQKISLEAGESREISFSLSEKDLRFINGKLEYMAEAGAFEIFIGTDSETSNKTVFTLTN
jgi:beta-glucosidase